MMFVNYIAVLVLAVAGLAKATDTSINTALGANSIFADVILVKVNYYRALAKANQVTWTMDNEFWSITEAANCSVMYDYWDTHGRIIFSIGRQDGGIPDVVNSTYFAIDHWWDMRHQYDTKSDEYDDLQPFYDSWEFTQMVWSSSTTIGCSWQVGMCDIPAEEQTYGVKSVKQLVCNMSPAGNRWQGWSNNVHCPDCTVQPQTTTIIPQTISIPTKRSEATSVPRAAFKQAADYKDDLERIEAYKHLSDEDFMAGHAGWSMS